MAQQILTNLDFNSASKIINLPNPVNAGDGVNKAYVDSQIEGLNWKDEAQVASQTNVSLTAPGSTIDGVTMTANMRVVLLAQTNAPDNGIYVWNGPSTALTRSVDANTPSFLENAVVSISLGTSAGVTYRQTAVGITVGTSNIAFVVFGSSAPAATTNTAGVVALATAAETQAGTVANKAVTPADLAAYVGFTKKYATTFGDGSSTSYTITHNLNTQDVLVEVYRNSGAYDRVYLDIDHTTVNTITLVSTAALASNAFRVVVIG